MMFYYKIVNVRQYFVLFKNGLHIIKSKYLKYIISVDESLILTLAGIKGTGKTLTANIIVKSFLYFLLYN